MQRRIFVNTAALAGFTSFVYAHSHFPERPLRLVVPFPAGGSTDILARLLAERLQQALHQSVVVENRPGGNNLIATRALLSSPADGYTLMIATNGMLSIAPVLYRSLPHDTVDGFTHLGFISSYPYLVVTRADHPYNTLQSFIDKTHLGEPVSYVVVGNVSAMVGAMLKQRAGVDWLEVRYKGNAEATSDLAAGRVDLAWQAPSFSLSLIQAGRLKALAVTSPQRMPQLPRVPTVTEALSFINDFSAGVWNALVAPPGLPPVVANTLSYTLSNIVQSDNFRAEMMRLAETKMVGTGAEVRQRILAEKRAWEQVVTETGMDRLN